MPQVLQIGQVGLVDLALDPKFHANHRLFFTHSEAVGGSDSNIMVARASGQDAVSQFGRTHCHRP